MHLTLIARRLPDLHETVTGVREALAMPELRSHDVETLLVVSDPREVPSLEAMLPEARIVAHPGECNDSLLSVGVEQGSGGFLVPVHLDRPEDLADVSWLARLLVEEDAPSLIVERLAPTSEAGGRDARGRPASRNLFQRWGGRLVRAALRSIHVRPSFRIRAVCMQSMRRFRGVRHHVQARLISRSLRRSRGVRVILSSVPAQVRAAGDSFGLRSGLAFARRLRPLLMVAAVSLGFFLLGMIGVCVTSSRWLLDSQVMASSGVVEAGVFTLAAAQVTGVCYLADLHQLHRDRRQTSVIRKSSSPGEEACAG